MARSLEQIDEAFGDLGGSEEQEVLRQVFQSGEVEVTAVKV